MKISVIVPAYNEEKLIVESLRAIKLAMSVFSARNWDTELIVCNNNSTDRTAELAINEGAKVVFEPINQISRARNCGAAAATGDWLVFVDADSFPTGELLNDAAEKIGTGRYVAGGCTVRMADTGIGLRFMTGLWNCISRAMKSVAGSFIFCDADAFRRVNGFSTELFAAEEIDLSKKLKRLSRQTRRKLIILHRFPLTTSARKFSLYSKRTHLRMLLRALLQPGKTLTNRDACELWYDGKR